MNVDRHNLICNRFPGYSLEGSSEVYTSLNQLVENCTFLGKGYQAPTAAPPKETEPTSRFDLAFAIRSLLLTVILFWDE